MSDDFQAVVELNSSELKDLFASLVFQDTNDFLQIGTYDLEGKTLSIGNASVYSLKIIPSLNKKLYLLAKKGKKMPAFTQQQISMGELSLPSQQSTFEFNEENKKPTQILKEMLYDHGLPKRSFRLEEVGEKGYSVKMEVEELRQILFQMFTAKNEMFFDEIQEVVDQPHGYLQNLLEEICNKRKIRTKFVYSLKALYQEYTADMIKGNLKKVKKV